MGIPDTVTHMHTVHLKWIKLQCLSQLCECVCVCVWLFLLYAPVPSSPEKKYTREFFEEGENTLLKLQGRVTLITLEIEL